MIILAFILTTASSVFGIFLLLLNPDLITGLVQSISLPTLIVSYAVSIATSLLFFFGVFDLVRRFKLAAKKPPGANVDAFAPGGFLAASLNLRTSAKTPKKNRR